MKKKELFHILVELEKAFDKRPRATIELNLQRQLVPERLVRLVMGLYDSSTSKTKFAGSSLRLILLRMWFIMSQR